MDNDLIKTEAFAVHVAEQVEAELLDENVPTNDLLDKISDYMIMLGKHPAPLTHIMQSQDVEMISVTRRILEYGACMLCLKLLERVKTDEG